ncbi:pilus assembly protein PilM [Nitrospina watsonii]|uniref:Type IV pilus biogenesis protein PilM (Modular protein) n=1 Tax=Nitrospina watsonii TaxID=1323948 RepID=A0ABM9HG79_9BACT|nr:pilus assembly protein PilM [Nitrospina watsonii]CAI2719246.1 Putative Type IV pilus biogenesis protein PilM (Modular protein) [Nitrospina watsonii]
MALSSFNQGKTAVGLDIGSHAIKMVELQPGRDGWSIGASGYQVVPKAMGDSANNEEMLAGLVRLLYSRQGIKTKRVYLTIGSYNILVRKVQIPKMPDSELVEAIKWDAREAMMFSPEEAVVDFHLLGQTVQEGLEFDELLAVIAPREEVERLVSIATEAGLEVAGILPLPLALEEYDGVWVEDTHKEDHSTCYIDMGAQRTRVYFVTGMEILFSREIPNSGVNITEALVGDYVTAAGRTVQVDEKRAEEIKLRYGLPPEGSEEETHDRIPVREFRERILPVVTRQVEEIERSIDSFVNTYIVTSVERVVFTGGATSLQGFMEYVRAHFDLTVSAYNPLSQLSSPDRPNLEDDAAEHGHSMVAAAGCAVDQCEKINLLPEEFRRSFSKTLQQLARLAPIPIAILLLAAFSVLLRLDLHDKEHNLAIRTQQLNQLKQRFVALDIPKRKLKKLKEEKEILMAEQAQLPRKQVAPVDLPRVLNEIAARVIWNMALEQITFSEYGGALEEDEDTSKVVQRGWALLVKGSIFGNREKVLKTLEAFLKDLKKSPLLSEVKLMTSQVTDTDRYTRKSIDFTLFITPVLRPGVT